MNAIDMLVVGGTATAADFAATIPNPVKTALPGTQATIYYLIRSTDYADAVPGCGYNTAYSPAGDVYSFVVTRSNAP